MRFWRAQDLLAWRFLQDAHRLVMYVQSFLLRLAAAAILWHRARRNRKVAKSSVRKHDSEEADIDKVAQPPPPCNDA